VNKSNEEEQKPKEVEPVLKERDYSTKRQIDRGVSDTSGSGQSGERWAGRSQQGSRDR
jgi:hypothetical protein